MGNTALLSSGNQHVCKTHRPNEGRCLLACSKSSLTIFSTSSKWSRSNSAAMFCDSHHIASQGYTSHVGTFSLLLPFKRRRFLPLLCCGLCLHLQFLTILAPTRVAKGKRRNRFLSTCCISMRTAILVDRGRAVQHTSLHVNFMQCANNAGSRNCFVDVFELRAF